MKKIILALALVAGVSWLGAASPASAAKPVEDKPGQEVCGPLDSGKIDTSGDPASVTVTAPEGKLIDEYCVKAGSDKSTPDGAVKYVSVDPAQKTVTITHYTGKAVSHYSVGYTDAPPPTTVPPTTEPPTTEPPTTEPPTTEPPVTDPPVTDPPVDTPPPTPTTPTITSLPDTGGSDPAGPLALAGLLAAAGAALMIARRKGAVV